MLVPVVLIEPGVEIMVCTSDTSFGSNPNFCLSESSDDDDGCCGLPNIQDILRTSYACVCVYVNGFFKEMRFSMM